MDPSPGLTLATLFADFGMILFALILVLLNGFFVAAEFAMVKLRSTRVEAIADVNGWRGQILGSGGGSRGDREACDQDSFHCHFSILL